MFLIPLRNFLAFGARGNRLLRRAAGPLSGIALVAGSYAYADTKRENYPQVYTMSPGNVNIQTGTFMHSRTDLSIGSLTLTRSYRTVPSFQPNSSGLNDHHYFGRWNHNFGYGVQIKAPGDYTEAHVYFEGQSVIFVKQIGAGVSYWQPYTTEAFGNELTEVSGKFVFRNRKGDIYYMRTDPQITHPPATQIVERVEFADGHRLDFSYNSAAKLRTVISNRGYALVFDYGSNGRIAAACGYNMAVTYVSAGSTCAGATLKVQYSYANSPYGPVLSRATDARNNWVDYQYDATFQKNLTCITLPNSATCEVANEFWTTGGATLPDQVKKQTMASGEIWQYSYLPPAIDHPPYPLRGWGSTTFMTDPGGFVTTATYTDGFLTSLQGRTGETLYGWYGTVANEFTNPGNIKEILGRDQRQNLVQYRRIAKPGTGLPDMVAIFAHPFDERTAGAGFPVGCTSTPEKLCNKPTHHIDENGHRTDFTYDPAHGGVLTETGPAVNGVRPQTRYTYAARTALVKDAGGGYSPMPSPVWVLTQTSSCKTGPSAGSGCAIAGDELVTTFDYGPNSGPNNLLLRGRVDDATGLALRTCYGYDLQGNQISETKPMAGLGSCP